MTTPTTPSTPGTTDPTLSIVKFPPTFPVNRQRIPLSVDPLGTQDTSATTALTPIRIAALSRVYLGLTQVATAISGLAATLAAVPLPTTVIGALVQPDGSTGARLQVEFDPKSVGQSGAVRSTLSDDEGMFTLTMPPGATLPDAGLAFTVHGADATVTVTVAANRIAATGLMGVIALPGPMAPVPVSILAALNALVPAVPATPPTPSSSTASLPTVTLGDEDACSMSYSAGSAIDKYPYGVFYRLIEPQMSIVNQVQSVPVGGDGGFSIYLPSYATEYTQVALQQMAQARRLELTSAETAGNSLTGIGAAIGATGTGIANPGTGTINPGTANAGGTGASGAGEDATPPSYIDRVPIEQPLSVDGFLDQIAGIDTTGTFTADETVPMAATLGLGYVLWMNQRWTFQGLSLGDLVYSLPLAPGEQTQVAVFERTDTAEVYESESFSETQTEQQQAMSDTSTLATFQSAFSEAITGSSRFSTDSSSWSVGGTIIVASGGYGASHSSGTSSTSLQGQRDSSQRAAETTQSYAANQASARRTANRTGMRLATASESEAVTTRTITNHNHTRALTMQYWQVLRNYDVTTVIDGLNLVCLVPMQIVRFMPPSQPQSLTDASQVGGRQAVLTRYAAILKHRDVLERSVPRRLQRGLAVLEQFAADPTAEVEPAGGPAEDVVSLSLTGQFLAAEVVSISAVTKRGTRVGPVQLGPAAGQTLPTLPLDTFVDQAGLLAWLAAARALSSVTLTGALALPPSMNRTDIIGFEITRRWNTVSYTLNSPLVDTLESISNSLGSTVIGNLVDQSLSAALAQAERRGTITLTSSDLESAVGGPALTGFTAAIEEFDSSGNPVGATGAESYANDSLSGIVLPLRPYPVPARQIAPVLRYSEILEIEQVAQHVVRNTTRYSRAVWQGLTPDERAILLDGYTIGVPSGGVADASQLVPLLNCVENNLLGFFGNSMIMPFSIPDDVATEMKIDPAAITESLLDYQRAAFVPPQTTITLPTHGVLGEAVLGHSASAE